MWRNTGDGNEQGIPERWIEKDTRNRERLLRRMHDRCGGKIRKTEGNRTLEIEHH